MTTTEETFNGMMVKEIRRKREIKGEESSKFLSVSGRSLYYLKFEFNHTLLFGSTRGILDRGKSWRTLRVSSPRNEMHKVTRKEFGSLPGADRWTESDPQLLSPSVLVYRHVHNFNSIICKCRSLSTVKADCSQRRGNWTHFGK